MFRSVLAHSGQALLTLLGTSLLIFAAVFVLPGDAVSALAGENGLGVQAEQALREKFHLNDTLPEQYLAYLLSVLRGDFGENVSGRNVSQLLSLAWPVTLQLGLTAWALECLLGLGFGVAAALRAPGKTDGFVLLVTIVSLAVPTFVVGLVLQHLIGLRLGWFPVAGVAQGWPIGYLLPALCLALVGFGPLARLTRASVLTARQSESVRIARARGIHGIRLVGRYVLHPGLVPLITYAGVSLAGLLGGAVIVESVFNVPGVGQQLVLAINNREGAVVVGIVTLLVFVVIVVNVVVDVAHRLIDPRVRRA